MPRCQRSFRRLGTATSVPGTGILRWNCPHCAQTEVYETVRDSDLNDYLRFATRHGERDFGVPDDVAWPSRLILGLRPECVREPDDELYDIYLSADADGWQTRLQIGHEIFHRLCSRGRVFHWTHEMLACAFSVRLIRRIGADRYAEIAANAYRQAAVQCTPDTVVSLDLWRIVDYPDGFYGRVFVMAETLESEIGWRRLCQLGTVDSTESGPNWASWLRLLSESEAARVGQIIGDVADIRNI